MSDSKTPIWEKCPCCDNFLCTIHGGHAHDCECPGLEVFDGELGINPYQEGGELSAEELRAKLAAIGHEVD